MPKFQNHVVDSLGLLDFGLCCWQCCTALCFKQKQTM